MIDAAWAAVLVAAINTVGAVLLEWIRHYYRNNGRKPPEK